MRTSRCLLAASVFLPACYLPYDHPDPGEMRMGVIGQDASGNIYRLRDGVFDLDGPETLSISTEDEPDPVNELNLELAAGNYDILLTNGWRLERWDPDMDETLDVEATLTSANPASATVTGTFATDVVFEFYVADAGPIVLGDGDLNIDIDVDADPTTCDPLVQDCPSGQGCYLDGADLTYECAPSVGVGLLQECAALGDCLPGTDCVSADAHTTCDDNGFTACCVQYCDTMAPTCNGAEACLQLAEDPGIGICTML